MNYTFIRIGVQKAVANVNTVIAPALLEKVRRLTGESGSILIQYLKGQRSYNTADGTKLLRLGFAFTRCWH